MTMYRLECSHGWFIALFSQMFFLGFTISAVIAPYLGDNYGRKKTVIVARLLNALIFVIMVLIPGGAGNYTGVFCMMLCVFLTGLVNNICIMIGYLYFCEFAPEVSGKTFGTLWNMQEGSCIIWITLYYWFISRDWRWPILFAAIGMFIGVTIQLFYIPESPKWLYEKQRFREL